MATVGRTARGLRRVPGYRQPEPPQPRRPEPSQGTRKRRPARYKLFSLGAGLDMPLLIFILVLMAIGLVMLFSASYAYSYYYYGTSYYFIARQATFAVVGVIAMLLISTFDYHSFHKLAIVVFGIAVFLLVFLLICRYAHIESIARPEGSATRWLDFGIVSFQPSEIAKFALIVMLAHMISQNLDKMSTFRYGVVPYVAIIGLFAVLIYLEDHLSATLIIMALGAILMFVGGTKPRWFLIGGGAVAALLVFIVVSKGGYQMDRITIWLDPFSPDLDRDLTHQTRQSLYAIGSGGLLGVGLQAVLNICVVTNTIPNTGISLPFFSYGGTALLMLLGEMGVLLNISRNSNVEKT